MLSAKPMDFHNYLSNSADFERKRIIDLQQIIIEKSLSGSS